MDAAGEELADRVRALFGADPSIEERRMFGTRAFLDEGRILVGARKDGTLLVRVDEENGAVAVTLPGAARAVMGSRTMGSGWIDVAASAIADDAALMTWIDMARESVGAALTDDDA
ncbi:TfoX/Sxy family protein [Microbacterium paraoxydans]|uniref:TfoX N-terminal domain-containing protein n=1 Tax=Microbacterium paraoxydans TaxID=199592 RepID=A0A1H1NCR8_9MICO|nr:TfoX/Sxy family protein [Microbacterium paraoxydans]SDR96169.1 TfoX N-terminal domain-containing protein [Microbacterium paraoxydans]